MEKDKRPDTMAGPIRSSRADPDYSTGHDERNGPILLRKHPRKRAAQSEEGNRTMDEKRLQRDEIRVLRRHPPFLRQLKARDRHEPNARINQRRENSRPYSPRYKRRNQDRRLYIAMVREYGFATA